jgi:tetratricopeptide (TPR) repeat protein
MALEGSLQDVGLADICQLLAMGRKTGCLTVTDRSNFGYVYFQAGRVIYASVLNRPDRLGELLVRNQVISRADLSRAMAEQAEDRGSRLGAILVKGGALTEDDLRRYVSLQIEEAVYHLFTWSQGAFHFDPEQTPDEEGIFLVDIPAENLLLEGARRVDEWSLIEKKIPSLDLVFEVVRTPGQADDEVELTRNQSRILPLVDGVRSVDEIVTESGLVEFDVGKALYGLIQAGYAQRAGRRSEVVGAAPLDEVVRQRLNLGVAFYRSGMLEDATREFQAVLEKDPRNASALFRLGLIAFRSRRPEEAMKLWDRMPEEWRDSYSVLRNRALALEALRRFDESAEALERAEAVRPGDPELQLAMGIALLRKGAVGPALKCLRSYRTAPDLKTPSEFYYAYTVLAAAIAGQLDYAITVGREGLVHYPESGPLLVNTGAVLEQRGELQAAEALYTRAVGRSPVPAQAHKSLGDQAYARGQHDQARIQYEKAVKIDPRLGDDVYLRLGTLAFQDRDRDVARLLWKRALDLNPDNQEVRSRLEGLDAPD